MKDYILENRDLIGRREILQLSMETANNRIEINKINSDMISLEKPDLNAMKMARTELISSLYLNYPDLAEMRRMYLALYSLCRIMV